MSLIRLEGLTKKFNGLTAVNSVSFEVKEGEIFGFLGPNGAGKTTTISMLATLLKPTGGAAFVNGFDITKDRDDVRRSIGIVFQDPSLDEELTAEENMDFHGRLYHIERGKRAAKIAELLELVELSDRKGDLVKTFSGGMRRRLEIARGLMHEPKVLFLDEPTLGLDPQTRNHIWEYIEGLNREKNVTIILTTHYMEEADRLASRVAIIDKGKIIALDTPKNLKDGVGGDVITVETKDGQALISKIEGELWHKGAQAHDGFLTISVTDAEKHVADIARIALGGGLEIRSINLRKPTLEDVFLHYTGRTIRDGAADSKEHVRLIRRARAGRH